MLSIVFKYFKQKWWEKVGEVESKKYVLQDYNSGKKIISELDSLGKPVYVIPGNWDFTSKSYAERTAGLEFVKYQDLIRNSKNLNWWKKGIKNLQGLEILAFGGEVVAGDYLNKGVLNDNEREKFIRENKKQTR